MNKYIKLILFMLGTSIGAFLINLESAYAVRYSDDGWQPPRSTETQEALENNLYNLLNPPQINYGRVSYTLERVRKQMREYPSNKSLLAQAIESQMQELMLELPEDLRLDLQKRWDAADWISFSKKGEHTLISRPLGETRVYSRKEFRLYLDERLKALPELKNLIEMIVLTHIVIPRLQVLESQGTAFYQRTHDALEAITLGTGYWTLTQWLQLAHVEKRLSSEIRQSSLTLADIRAMLAEVQLISTGDSVQVLNQYIKWHHPMALSNSKLKEFFQSWLNQTIGSSSVSKFISQIDKVGFQKNHAKVIPFTQTTKLNNTLSCQRVFLQMASK